ncbi:MAG: alpha/beta hydrolase, partial [Limibaculum sp.]
LAELWHFLGREGLPIVYTWPAGHPGIFGYTYDRESSEFTVFHLKQVIKWLSEQPEIENIHLIAHSRGTDVAVSAFRELVIWARGAGLNPRERFKIKNFVMAAADLDMQVMSQRVAAERLGLEVDQVTVYTSPDDQAIGIAELFFASPRGRVGTLEIGELNEQEIKTMKANAARVTIVNFDGGRSTGYGHDYFRTNAAVSSDLVLKLRYGLRPGEAGRPLEHIGLNFWRIPEGYPANAEIE